ncbi:hypothetical protein HOD75_02840 [archaeon]|jgi:hypothetical protein|nr:hypothetical protein [archaeon]MBT4241811.1 hypothetical protein [archaeon]MBT4418359.1 hypothetical protein [archaeon]
MTEYNKRTLDIRERLLGYFNASCNNAVDRILEPRDYERLDDDFLEGLAVDDSMTEPEAMWRAIVERIGQPRYLGRGLSMINNNGSFRLGTFGAELVDCYDTMMANEEILQKPMESKPMDEIMAEADADQARADKWGLPTGQGYSAERGSTTRCPRYHGSGVTRRGNNQRSI